MKTIKTKSSILGMVLLAVVMLCAAGCTKDNGENNENGGNNGNSWNDGGDNGGGGNSGGGGNNNGGVELVGTYNGHQYVDLGLPSGTKWATCNVGASTPEGSGSYFAWGETTTKSSYGFDNYKYGYEDNDGYFHLNKYNTHSEYGPIDNLTVLQASDDAATAKWGSGWRTPSNAEWEELCGHTSITLTAQNGVKGFCFTASNGGSIFLPAVGYCLYSDLNFYGRTCSYWMNQLSASSSIGACNFYSINENYSLSDFGLGRGCGCPVRAVH